PSRVGVRQADAPDTVVFEAADVEITLVFPDGGDGRMGKTDIPRFWPTKRTILDSPGYMTLPTLAKRASFNGRVCLCRIQAIPSNREHFDRAKARAGPRDKVSPRPRNYSRNREQKGANVPPKSARGALSAVFLCQCRIAGA